MANFYGQFIGFGAGGVAAAGYHGAGVSYGFSSTGGVGGTNYNRVDKFSLTSSSDATDVGDVTVARRSSGGAFSPTHGYTHGGYDGFSDVIDKYSMSSDGDSSDVGNLTGSRTVANGASSITYGYSFGGEPSTVAIEKFSFASDGDSTAVGDLTAAGRTDHGGGTQSSTHGYCMGGGNIDEIDTWTFESDADATDVGDLTQGGYNIGGNSEGLFGYSAGRMSGSSTLHDIIDKFSMSSTGNATDVGNLTVAKSGCFGQNSATHGYASGASDSASVTIEKFSFASGGDAVDASQDLTQQRGNGGSAQI